MSEEDKEPLLKDWKTTLPEELQSDKSLEDFDDVGKLARAFVDTKADNGRSIRIPGPDASTDVVDSFNAKLLESVPGLMQTPDVDNAEAMNGLYDKLGRPKAPSDYATPEGLPDSDLGRSMETQLGELKKSAYETGLSKKQFDAQAKAIVENFKSQVSVMDGKTAEEQEKLRLDWGSALDSKYKSALDLAQQTDAPESVRNGIANRTLDSATMKWIDGMVTALSDSPQMRFQGQQDDTRVTPAEAEAQIHELMERKEYWDATSPMQAGLVKKVVDLEKIAQSAT